MNIFYHIVESVDTKIMSEIIQYVPDKTFLQCIASCEEFLEQAELYNNTKDYENCLKILNILTEPIIQCYNNEKYYKYIK